MQGALFTLKLFIRYHREEKKVNTNKIFLCSYIETCHHHANTWVPRWLHSTIYSNLPNRVDPGGPAKAEEPEKGKPTCNMRVGAVACNSPGIMAFTDGSWVLIAEGQVVEELPETTQGINIIFKSSMGNT